MEFMFKELVRNWAQEEFGNPNALPEPVLNSLAEYICTKHDWEFYNSLEAGFLLEDINDVALDKDIELTADEIKYIYDRYKKERDDATDECVSTIYELVDWIKSNRKKKSQSSLSPADNKQQQK